MGNYWVAVAFALLGPLLMWRVLFGRTRRPTFAVQGDGESLSVIIPARNEAQRLPALLRSLQQQTVSPREIIVVDDESTDDTVAIATAAGARVLGGQPLPEGWNGKAWACWQGAAASGGELLLFLDADTWLEPDGLNTLLQLHATHGGLISVQPYHVTERAYEGLSAIFNVIQLAGVGACTPLGERVVPRHPHVPGARPPGKVGHQPVQGAQEGGLARPRGPRHEGEFPRFHRERHVAQDGLRRVGISVAEVLDGDHGSLPRLARARTIGARRPRKASARSGSMGGQASRGKGA